jgi:hypothetical protein
VKRRIIAGLQANLQTAPNWPGLLDQFALTANQHYNLGNAGNWFFSFRGGQYGVMSRLRGLQQHSLSLHQWRMDTSVQSHEHDIAVMLFCMDSAIECFVFMLNALGQAVDKTAFRDVSSEKTLQKINPDDVLGAKRPALDGYAKYFPTLQAEWQSQTALFTTIFENHDVTKHRQQAGVSGKGRPDPPTGFFASMGIPNDPISQALHGPMHPMQEVILPKRPKLPIEQASTSSNGWTTLEGTEKEFCALITNSFRRAVEDTRKTIILKDPTLHP